MFKLLIVDDEPLIREGLRKTIPWESIGFEIIGEASSGSEALSIVNENTPDVVITDMRMEDIDGSELIQNLSLNFPNINIVIMTAYSDFSYAKLAVDNRVFAYITKPSSNSDIISIFKKLYIHLEKQSQLNKTVEEFKNYQMNEIFYSLIHNPSPNKQELESLNSFLQTGNIETDYFIAILSRDSAETPEISHSEYLILNERIDYYISTYSSIICRCNLTLYDTVLMVFTKSHDYSKQIKPLKHIYDDFYSLTGKHHLAIGVSATFRSLSSINHAYLQAKKALEQNTHNMTIIDYLSLKKQKKTDPSLNEQEISSIISSIANADSENACKVVKSFFDAVAISDMDIFSVKSIIADLMIQIIKKIFKNSHTTRLLFNKDIRPVIDMQYFSDLSEIKEYITSFVQTSAYSMKKLGVFLVNEEKYSPAINRTISYIIENYTSDIKIGDMSKSLYISESHLMHMFKKETGKTFGSFLTEYRIRLAEIMLKSGYYNLYEVRELVGYHNPISFRKAFHKITGVVPSHYTHQQSKE